MRTSEKNRAVSVGNEVILDADQTQIMLMGFSPAALKMGLETTSRVALEMYIQPRQGFKLHRLPTNKFRVPFKYLVYVVVDDTLHRSAQAVFCPELPDSLEFMQKYASVIYDTIDRGDV